MTKDCKDLSLSISKPIPTLFCCLILTNILFLFFPLLVSYISFVLSIFFQLFHVCLHFITKELYDGHIIKYSVTRESKMEHA